MVKKSITENIKVSTILFIIGVVLIIGSGAMMWNSNRIYKDALDIKETGIATKLWNPELRKIEDIIKNYYVGDLPSDKVIQENIIKGYVESLGDKYSIYLTKNEYEELKNTIDEKFVGIGVQYDFKDGNVLVNKVFYDAPAQKAGIKAGDYIIKVEDKDVSTFVTTEGVAKAIKGDENTNVKLEVITKGEAPRILNITRQKINLPLISTKIEGDTAIVHVNSFGDNLENEISRTFGEINNKPEIKKLILDLQDNPGGRVEAAVSLISHFVDPGVVVLKQKTKAQTEETKSIKVNNNIRDKKVIVLQTKYSASASEITALALRELIGSPIIGQTSYGKGVAQGLFDGTNLLRPTLTEPSENALKLTTAEWLGPKGSSINKVGIKPDIDIQENILENVLTRYNWDTKELAAATK
jgi:carboxyl-terminal processing protease